MDYFKVYRCINCKTSRFLIFPYGDERLIICSACYRQRKIVEEEQELSLSY